MLKQNYKNRAATRKCDEVGRLDNICQRNQQRSKSLTKIL